MPCPHLFLRSYSFQCTQYLVALKFLSLRLLGHLSDFLKFLLFISISLLAEFACLTPTPKVLGLEEVLMSEVSVNQQPDATGHCTAPSQEDKDLLQE